MKKYLLVTLLLISVAILPMKVFAQGMGINGTPFGGFVLFQLPCTCTGGSTWWALFFPFFYEGVETGGALVWNIGDISYPNYLLFYWGWGLGFFNSGGGTCEFGIDPYCYNLPNYGTVNSTTGTSITV